MIQYRTRYEEILIPMNMNRNIIMLHEVKYKSVYKEYNILSYEFDYIRPVMINLNFVTHIEPCSVKGVDKIHTYISLFKTCTYHIGETVEEINELINGRSGINTE